MAPDDGGAAPPAAIQVEVVWAPADAPLRSVSLSLPVGCTAAQALRASGLSDGLSPQLLDSLALAVWGRLCSPATPLHDGDRLALLRPLRVDPKEARRQRFRRDGVRKPAPPRR